MREIKFRAWLKKESEMKKVHDICFNKNETEPIGIISCGRDNCESCIDYYNFAEVELMQYTGLKDKNGVEIYEGDIVRFNDGIYEIRYWQQAFRYKHLDDGDYIGCIGEYLDSCEIIGNIHENKELLDEQN